MRRFSTWRVSTRGGYQHPGLTKRELSTPRVNKAGTINTRRYNSGEIYLRYNSGEINTLRYNTAKRTTP